MMGAKNLFAATGLLQQRGVSSDEVAEMAVHRLWATDFKGT